jgi:magnesium chelatase subunit I
VVPAITGKIELVYEGEQEGPYQVAMNLFGQAVKKLFLAHFPDPDKLRKGQQRDPYGVVRAWFAAGNTMDLLNDADDQQYQKALDAVAGLRKLTETYTQATGEELYTYMELALHGLTECNILNKEVLESSLSFRDLLANMLGDEEDDFDEEDLN